MGDTITYTPNTGVNPTFVGRGSKIEHPDILPIFLGSYWPGIGDLTVTSIMAALNAIASGPYLEGLKQYGYMGPATVRGPQLDSSTYTVTLPPLAPGVDQAANVGNAVGSYIQILVDNDKIANLDDNHDLIVLIFLDPSNPLPQKMDGSGNVTTSASGANTWFDQPEPLDDATRFEWSWINTTGGLASATQIASHELVESITDPFGSGWHQTAPASLPTAGQVTDVCNQLGIAGGVAVTAYWSAADQACIVPTPGTRRVVLSRNVTKHEPHDGPPKRGYVNMGSLCASGYFDYFERTYVTAVTINAALTGYESPMVDWRINGMAVPFVTGVIDVPVDWDPEPPPWPPSLARPSIWPSLFKPDTAQLMMEKLSASATQIGIQIGPNAGNADITIEATVTESFDVPTNGGTGSTARRAALQLSLKDQEIVWSDAYTEARRQCNRIHHLSAGPAGVLGRPLPGDPPDLANIIALAVGDTSSDRGQMLRYAAEMVRAGRPQLAADLAALADRASPGQLG